MCDGNLLVHLLTLFLSLSFQSRWFGKRIYDCYNYKKAHSEGKPQQGEGCRRCWRSPEHQNESKQWPECDCKDNDEDANHFLAHCLAPVVRGDYFKIGSVDRGTHLQIIGKLEIRNDLVIFFKLLVLLFDLDHWITIYYFNIEQRQISSLIKCTKSKRDKQDKQQHDWQKYQSRVPHHECAGSYLAVVYGICGHSDVPLLAPFCAPLVLNDPIAGRVPD